MNSLSLTVRRPYPHHARLERKKPPMTIAVGLVCDDGLVFCVDTKISTSIKTEESKLAWCVYSEGKNCATAFAVSGIDLKFAKTAIDFCEEAVAKINFKDKSISVETVRKAIQSALAKFYKEHIFPHPDRGVGGAVDFEFLIGIWLNNETRLFESRETVLSPVREYECRGIGAYLAKFLIRQYLRANPGPLTLMEAAVLAEYAVGNVADYDENCGGEIETLFIRNNGDCGNGYDKPTHVSRGFIETLQGEQWKMIRQLLLLEGDAVAESKKIVEAVPVATVSESS